MAEKWKLQLLEHVCSWIMYGYTCRLYPRAKYQYYEGRYYPICRMDMEKHDCLTLAQVHFCPKITV